MSRGKFLLFIFLLIIAVPLEARGQVKDSDGDGVPDKDEINIYSTDPFNADTDGDGYNDWIELNSGYSPHNAGEAKLENNDHDKDGLSDKMELRFGTDIADPDTDGDGYKDGKEVSQGYDPLSADKKKLDKRIEVDTSRQELSYFLDGVKRGEFPVSTGVPEMPTPKGHFYITNKNPRAWSSYGLWMPYWMALGSGRIGIHQLPVWPDGSREGEDHLGRPASHGCIRLGMEPSKFLYDWAPVGTSVFVF